MQRADDTSCGALHLEGKHCLTEQSQWKSSDVGATADWLTAPCAKTLAELNAIVLSHWIDLYDICNATSSTDRAQWQQCKASGQSLAKCDKFFNGFGIGRIADVRRCRDCCLRQVQQGMQCTSDLLSLMLHTSSLCDFNDNGYDTLWNLSFPLPQSHELLQQESYYG